MEEQDVKNLIQKELDENYVSEKVYWQRTVRMIVVVLSILLGIFGGVVAWGFKTSTEVTNNTQGRRDIERRMEVLDRQQAVILQNYAEVAKNQQEVLTQSNRLSRKLDVLIDKAGARYTE